MGSCTSNISGRKLSPPRVPDHYNDCIETSPKCPSYHNSNNVSPVPVPHSVVSSLPKKTISHSNRNQGKPGKCGKCSSQLIMYKQYWNPCTDIDHENNSPKCPNCDQHILLKKRHVGKK